MARVLALLAVLLTLGDATGMLPASAEAVGEDSCHDDDAGGQCPSGCADCVCCPSHARIFAAIPLALVVPAPRFTAAVVTTDNPHPSPDPLGIFHIPKRSLV